MKWSRLEESLSNGVFVSDSISIPTGYGNVTRVSVTLTILTASREDTGEYMCSASNEIGSDYSNVSIIVECKFIETYTSSGLKLICKATCLIAYSINIIASIYQRIAP